MSLWFGHMYDYVRHCLYGSVVIALSQLNCLTNVPFLISGGLSFSIEMYQSSIRIETRSLTVFSFRRKSVLDEDKET